MVKHRNVNTKEDEVKSRMDYLLITIILMLAAFGIVMVFDSSIAILSNKYHFVLLQTLWVGVGLVLMFIVSRFHYKKYPKISLWLMIIEICMLAMVLVIGRNINGAVRWIQIGPLEFQPSEIAKPIYIIYLASWFSKDKEEIGEFNERAKAVFFNELIPFIAITSLILLLVILGRDLGTAIVIAAVGIGLYFVQGKGMLSLISFFASISFFGIAGAAAILLEPYRLKRLLTFSGSSNDPLKGGYQISQILIAIGSGGVLGKGFTQSIQKQRYLVETTAATDSIFAVIAEEFGFIGAVVLILGYIFLFYRCIRIAIKSPDKLSMLLVVGVTIWIITQALINIAVNVSLVPLTGIPLPLISYGGSSTIILLAAFGIILNISKYIHEQRG